MNLDPKRSSAQTSSNRPSESEPEEYTPPATASVQTNSSNCRSCYACNRKKVRCDKRRPCSSCIRSGKPCSYPSPGPRIRRSKKTIAAEMASRISSLEKSLAKTTDARRTGQSGPDSMSEDLHVTISTQPARETPSGNLSERSREDVLIQNGSASQYFNEILLSRVLEEVSFADVDSRSTASIISDH